MKEIEVKSEDKSLLGELILEQKYALEIVSCVLADIENGVKQVDDNRRKELNNLYDRLVKAGF